MSKNRTLRQNPAMDPVTKLLLTIDVGDRTLAMAQSVVHQVVQVLAPGCVPLFLTDGFKEYATALLTHFGQWVQPPRRQDKGPAPKPRWMPLPGLCYAQVIKTVRQRRLVRVRHRVVFGTPEDLAESALEIIAAASIWADEESTAEYRSQVRWRFLLDYDAISPPRPPADDDVSKH